jgi:hypothetical protein
VFHDGLANIMPNLVTEIVRRSDRATSFCPNVGLSSAPSVGWVAVAGWQRTGKISTTMRSRSSASHPYA